MKKNGLGQGVSLEYVALLLLFYVFLPSFVLSVFLLLNVGSPRMAYWLSVSLILAGAAFCRKKIGFADLFLFAAIVAAAHVVAYGVFDTFIDGFVYHQPAIRRIAAGFNPVYDGYADLGRARDIWSDVATYYPKGFWYFAASVMAAWGDIQMGKAYHLILLAAAIFFVYRYTEDSRVKKALWVLACLNPILLSQYTSYAVDGEVGTLTLIGLFYANCFFSGKTIPRPVHVFGITALAMLFCTKASGFAYGGIVMFCIALHAGASSYRELRKNGELKKNKEGKVWIPVFSSFVKTGLKLGIPVMVLVLIIGYSPYVLNLLEGRHLFYVIAAGEQETGRSVQGVIEQEASDVYPDAHNRFTRFALSLFSYPTFDHRFPAELKNPLGAPLLEWRQYADTNYAKAAGFGPFFPLLLIISVAYRLVLRRRGGGWLLFTLFFLTFVQPHAWQARLVPFVWFFPFFLLLPMPKNKEYLLAIPILLSAVNIGGVAYVATEARWRTQKEIERELEPYRGQVVLLDKSIFQFDGIFDRFDIRQKIANPESAHYSSLPWAQARRERNTGRHPFGSNIAFEEDIPFLPEGVVSFDREMAKPWLTMSEGVMLHDPQNLSFWSALSDGKVHEKGCWNYSNKVKIFVRVREKPTTDMEFTLTVRPDEGSVLPLGMTVFANYRELGEWEFDAYGSSARRIAISREILEESSNDDMHLLTLMFYLYDSDGRPLRPFGLRFEAMAFEERRAGECE